MLYEKYVDVVFQREKSKIELVSLYEKELRILHEQVGYNIHDSLSKGDSGAVTENKFMTLINDVWRLTRGDHEFSGILNMELKKTVYAF